MCHIVRSFHEIQPLNSTHCKSLVQNEHLMLECMNFCCFLLLLFFCFVVVSFVLFFIGEEGEGGCK